MCTSIVTLVLTIILLSGSRVLLHIVQSLGGKQQKILIWGEVWSNIGSPVMSSQLGDVMVFQFCIERASEEDAAQPLAMYYGITLSKAS